MTDDEVNLHVATMDSPVGPVWLAATARGVCALGIGPRAEHVLVPSLARRFGRPRLIPARDPHGAVSRLAAYFESACDLGGIPLDVGGTPFQARVWSALRAIPLGRTVSYADLAARIGAPRAFRAVARANATNPVSLFVPCHRVIGADGELRGYGWGPERKDWLLRHEALRARRGETDAHCN